MDWAEYSRIMFEKCKQKGMPLQATFEVTPFCNFKCNMCYVRLDHEQAKAQGEILNTEQWLRIASETKRMGTVILELTGGEAISRPDFSVLYESFIKMGFLINLRTNGYLIKNEILDLIKKFKPRRVSVTLYGASDETYKKVCDVSDGFSVVTKNVLAMKEAGINVHLTMTVTKDNVEDINPLKHWAEEHGLAITPFGGLITPIRGAKRSINHLQVQLPEEEFNISEELLKSTQHEITDRPTLMNPFWMCRGFGAKFSISWDGRMTICNTFTSIWKNPIVSGVEKAYYDLYHDLKNLSRPQECSTCPYIEFCAACPSQLLSASGNAEQTCENICKLARRKYKRHYLSAVKKQAVQNMIIDECEEGEDFSEN